MFFSQSSIEHPFSRTELSVAFHYGVLTDGTAHAIALCAAVRRYTRSPAQATPGSQSMGASPQMAGTRRGGGRLHRIDKLSAAI
jgi:hypothetical protein